MLPRRTTTRWRKGQSGNPHGAIDKGSRAKIREIRMMALVLAPAALDELNRLVHHAKDESVRVAAAKALLDRAGVRVPKTPLDERPEDEEAIDVSPEAQAEAERLAAMRDDELIALVGRVEE